MPHLYVKLIPVYCENMPVVVGASGRRREFAGDGQTETVGELQSARMASRMSDVFYRSAYSRLRYQNSAGIVASGPSGDC